MTQAHTYSVLSHGRLCLHKNTSDVCLDHALTDPLYEEVLISLSVKEVLASIKERAGWRLCIIDMYI